MNRFLLGWQEWISLPGLGLPAIKAKIDTGARSAALHAVAVEPFGPTDNPQVRFIIQPDPDDPDLEITCSAPVIDRREVRSSNGDAEMRYFIRTEIMVGARRWPIEVSLTNRETMSLRMLIGREALGDEAMVLPDALFQQPELSFALYDSVPRRRPVQRPLRIALLTMEPENYSSRRLVEAGRLRGHIVEPVDTTRCYMRIDAERPEIHYDGEVLPDYDAVIPRIGAGITFYGMAVLRQFATMGTYAPNSAEAIGRSRDKLLAHQLLAAAGVRMPTTAFASSPKDTKDLIALAGEAPVVVKLLESSQGRGVVLAETRKTAASLIDAFRDLKANFLVQHFVGEAAGSDVRAFVVGNKVVGAMRRQAAEGEFRSNLHRGGTASPIKLTAAEREAALKATRAMGLGVAGVDILQSETGPLVLEVNSSPGLQGIESATGRDIAGLVIQHIERNVRPLSRKGSRA
jgi:ribosomal protein S6--L-glutamate ligase